VSRLTAAGEPGKDEKRTRGSIWRRRGMWAAVPAAALLLVGSVILFPRYASAYLVERAGRILNSSPASEDARTLLVRAIERNPRNAQAYRLLACLDTERGDWPSTVSDWGQFVALRPTDPQGYWSLAAACERLAPGDMIRIGDHPCGTDEESRPEALARLWRAAGQTSESFLRAGDAAQETSRDEAVEYYKRALLLDPQLAAAWKGLGSAYRSLAKDDLALEAYAAAVELGADPETKASARAARGAILAAKGQWDQARVEMAAAAGLAPTDGTYRLNYGWYLMQAGSDREEARAQLLEAARLLPADPWAHVYLSILAFSGEEYETALEEAHTAAALDRDLFWAWLWRGKALAAVGRLPEAEDSLRRAIYLAPERAEPHAELGQFLAQASRFDEAIAELEKAAQVVPSDLALRFLLAGAYRSGGRATEAVRVYREILELDRGNEEAKQALAELGY